MGIVRNQSIKNSISFYIGMVIGAVNTVIIYPNVFEDKPEHFGLIQILIAYAIVVSTFTTFGIPKTFVKFFPTIKEKGQLYFLSIITPLIGFVLASLSYFLFKEQIFGLLNASELLRDNFFYIILLVFFIGFYDVLTAISRSFLSAATPTFINEVFLKFYSMSVLLLHWFDFLDFSTFLKIYLFGFVLKFAILLFIQWKNDRFKFNMSIKDIDIKELIRFGVFVMVGGASIMIVTRVDMMMIGSLLDLQQVAFYTVAFFIGNAIKVPAKSIGAISIPLVAMAWENQDYKQIQTLYSKSSINQLIFGGVFFVCIWLNIDEVFSLLPDNFRGGKWVVFYIGLSQLFNIASGVNGTIIINSKYYRYDLYTNVILVFITIATNYILIPKYGIDGAAMATAISVLLFNMIRLVLIKVKMNMQPFSKQTVITFLVLLFVYFIVDLFPLSSVVIFDIIWKSLLALLLFVPIVLKLNLSEDISGIVKDLKNRLIN
ncbi:MAG: oligosaccharide flippase family protein [Bacteroidota bacterium]|nr:oligosaccharide flippase family protein [Bacteroidota bacterium]